MSTEDGGPAFPMYENHDGMTLRDWFAGNAPIGLTHPMAPMDDHVKARWAYADAMLKARQS